MAVVLTSTLDMERSKWLEYRRKGLGGSDASAVAGLNPWRSPIEVYLDKIGEIPEIQDNELMYWGRVLEDVVAKEFTERTGKKVRRRNAILVHPKYDFMLANVDRLIVGEKVGLECKTTSEYAKDQWEEDEVPDHYILQCQHYMAVTGYIGWWIAVLIGGNKFRYKYIPRDEDIINYLIQIESEFWQMVIDRTPPAVDGTESSSDILKFLYPTSNPKLTASLPTEAKELIADYQAAHADEKAAKVRKNEAGNKLKALLGDAEKGRTDEYTISWKTITSKRLDQSLLRTEEKDIYEKYLKPSNYRRLSFRKNKK